MNRGEERSQYPELDYTMMNLLREDLDAVNEDSDTLEGSVERLQKILDKSDEIYAYGTLFVRCDRAEESGCEEHEVHISQIDRDRKDRIKIEEIAVDYEISRNTAFSSNTRSRRKRNHRVFFYMVPGESYECGAILVGKIKTMKLDFNDARTK